MADDRESAEKLAKSLMKLWRAEYVIVETKPTTEDVQKPAEPKRAKDAA